MKSSTLCHSVLPTTGKDAGVAGVDGNCGATNGADSSLILPRGDAEQGETLLWQFDVCRIFAYSCISIFVYFSL